MWTGGGDTFEKFEIRNCPYDVRISFHFIWYEYFIVFVLGLGSHLTATLDDIATPAHIDDNTSD
jgi:bacteriorhodopsin